MQAHAFLHLAFLSRQSGLFGILQDRFSCRQPDIAMTKKTAKRQLDMIDEPDQ
jgi:hypothetical protein